MKKKKVIIILLVLIAILSFVIPVKKNTINKVISHDNPPGFFGGGFTTVEKFNVYYNIYRIPIMKVSTGEIEKIS